MIEDFGRMIQDRISPFGRKKFPTEKIRGNGCGRDRPGWRFIWRRNMRDFHRCAGHMISAKGSGYLLAAHTEQGSGSLSFLPGLLCARHSGGQRRNNSARFGHNPTERGNGTMDIPKNKLPELLREIRVQNATCQGCAYESGCTLHGCAILRSAAKHIEALQAEKAAMQMAMNKKAAAGDTTSVPTVAAYDEITRVLAGYSPEVQRQALEAASVAAALHTAERSGSA